MITAEEFQEGRVLLIDKPLQWSSFQAVNKIKWAILKHYKLKKIKIGHAGTLDPLASGLLVICTGKFTKKITEIQDAVKTYTGTIKLGATTSSFDMETPIEKHYPTEHITPELIESVRQQFEGELMQTPPVFSAIKKDGKRLYEFAREGEAIEVPKRTVYIHRFELDISAFPELHFAVQCSKGTYIRSLANDFGKALGSGAYLSALRRTQIGNYDVTEALSPDDFVAIHIPDLRHSEKTVATKQEDNGRGGASTPTPVAPQKKGKQHLDFKKEWQSFVQMFSAADKSIALTLLILFCMLITLMATQLHQHPKEVLIEMALDSEKLPEEWTPAEVHSELTESLAESSAKTAMAYNQTDAHLQHSEAIKTLNELIAERDHEEMYKAETALISQQPSATPLPFSDNPLEKNVTNVHTDKVNKHTLVKYALQGRTGHIPNPVFTCEREGQVVVRISVDSAGRVTKTSIDKQSTTTDDDCLLENSLVYARQAHFNSVSSPKEQIGSITYIFERKR